MLGPGSHGSDHLIGGICVEENVGLLAVDQNSWWGVHDSPAMWAGALGEVVTSLLLHRSSAAPPRSGLS